ncbi:MAG: metallophosphoesterase family protein [Gemmatimonadaceae bacterium]|nr:metallophosphoesterase family protein [Gemmatimonadaceae bacterium]
MFALVAVLSVVAALVVAGVAYHAIVVAPGDLRLVFREFTIDALAPSFDGYRIAILSDFHHGPQQPRARAARAVAFANSQSPDLVALLGDYGTSEGFLRSWWRRSYLRMHAELSPVLTGLRARDGIVAVIGNHDHYGGADETERWLDSLGIRVLRDARAELRHDDGALHLVGIHDFWEGDVTDASVAALVDSDTPTIVLSHHPDALPHCAHPGVALVLSGHTHGGQVVLPFIGAPVTRSVICTRHHASGWIPNPWVPMLVSSGVGAQIPLRFGTRPEVVILTLRAGQGAAAGKPRDASSA